MCRVGQVLLSASPEEDLHPCIAVMVVFGCGVYAWVRFYAMSRMLDF